MTTYAFPTLSRNAPSEMSWGMHSPSLVHTSPLSGQIQTIELPGARWVLSFSFRNLVAADRALLEAFLAKMRGQANRFTVHDLSKPEPLGTFRGSPTTQGTTLQGATSVTFTGGAGQAATTILTGDKFSFGGELKIATANATANGSGVITVNFEPPLRASVGASSAVTLVNPTALFMLSEPSWELRPRAGRIGMADFDFEAVEVFA